MGISRRGRWGAWCVRLAVAAVAVAAPAGAVAAPPTFGGPLSSQTLGTVADGAVGDITHDGIPDIVSVAAGTPGAPCVNAGATNGRFAFRAGVFPYPCGGNADLIATGDVNDDGGVDVVTASAATGAVQVYLNSGGTLVVGASLPLAGRRPVSLVVVPNPGRDVIVVTTDQPGGRRTCGRSSSMPAR